MPPRAFRKMLLALESARKYLEATDTAAAVVHLCSDDAWMAHEWDAVLDGRQLASL